MINNNYNEPKTIIKTFQKISAAILVLINQIGNSFLKF